MTISTSSNTQIVAGTGSQYAFNFSFIADAAAYIVVSYMDADGNVTILNTSQYTLALNAAAANQLWGVGGTVTYPLSGSAISAGTYLIIQRLLPYTQQVSIQNQGNFYARVTEQALDVLAMQIQQVAARSGQFRGVWATDIFYPFGDIVVDGPAGNDTGNYYTCLNSNTSGVWATDLAAGDWGLAIDVQSINASAAAAAASATAAAASATAAASSAASAATSASTASTNATAAAASATNAATSAGSATTSANAAAASAISAATSAASSTASASAASVSATSAATSATSAATSANNAAASATSAAASAVLAASTLTSTSATSNTIGTGTLTFATQTNKQYISGQFILSSSGVNYVAGTVSTYNPATGSLVIDSTTTGGSGTYSSWNISVIGAPGLNGAGTGTVTSFAFTNANGISGSVSTPTSTPNLTLTLGAITPTSVTASGAISGSNLSGTNTGDQVVPANTTGTAHQFFSAYNSTTGAYTKTQPADIDISFTDNSTGNASTSAHGYLPKLDNTAAHFLNGQGTYAAVTDANLSTSDITTNNVSISKHGFCPKLPNDAAKFLNGTGAYSSPTAGITSITNSLGADVVLSNVGLYFTGPTVAQGSSGTWLATGTVTVSGITGDRIRAKLWDGATVIASAQAYIPATNGYVAISLSGVLATPAGNLCISVNADSNSDRIKFNASGNSMDSTITAIKIA